MFGHKLPQHGVVGILMPMGLHHFFVVPVGLALQVASNQSEVVLHDRHGVAIGVGRNGFKTTAHKSGAIVKDMRRAWPRHTTGAVVP